MEHVTLNSDGSITIILGVGGKQYCTPILILAENYLLMRDTQDTAEHEIPEWLADGIRELAKNKIEQENNRGA